MAEFMDPVRVAGQFRRGHPVHVVCAQSRRTHRTKCVEPYQHVAPRGATSSRASTRVFIFSVSPAPLLRPTQKLALATDSTHRAAPQPRTATHRAPRCCSVRPVSAQCAHHRVHPFPLRKSLARLTCPTQERRRTTAVSPPSYACPGPPSMPPRPSSMPPHHRHHQHRRQHHRQHHHQHHRQHHRQQNGRP